MRNNVVNDAERFSEPTLELDFIVLSLNKKCWISRTLHLTQQGGSYVLMRFSAKPITIRLLLHDLIIQWSPTYLHCTALPAAGAVLAPRK